MNMTIKPGFQKLVCHLSNCYLLPNAYVISVFLVDKRTSIRGRNVLFCSEDFWEAG